MAVPILEVKGLCAGYGNAVVLENVTLRAARGTIVSVLGLNGAGKSTLLNSLGGVIPSQGIVMLDGEDISTLPVEERVMVGIALVPETRELFGTMTVEENLLLGGHRPRSLGDRAWRDGLEPVYALFPRLKERRRQQSSTLSGGERQMLALGRALMSRPRLLLLDEPSLGLAPLIVQDIMRTVSRLSVDGLTVLLVEQNARAALEIAHYGYVLEMGSFLLEGPADLLRSDERLISTYLGSAQSATPAVPLAP